MSQHCVKFKIFTKSAYKKQGFVNRNKMESNYFGENHGTFITA